MSDAAGTTAPVMPASQRRWLRRYGLAAVGAVIILAWLLLALLAPWVTRYDPNAVNVAGR